MKQRRIQRPDMPLNPLVMSPVARETPSPESANEEVQSNHDAPAPQVSNVTLAPAAKVLAAGELIDIPVTRLRVSPYNARKNRLPKRVSKIAASLKSVGQKDPIYVYPGVGEDEGYFLILGGETRRLAALQIAKPTLKAFVDRDVDPADILTLTKISLILNDSAVECDLDRAMVVMELLEQGHTQHEVAEVLELESHTHIQRLQKLATLPKRFITLGQDYPERFSASLGALISPAIDKHGEDFAFDLLKSALVNDMTHRKIAKQIELGPTTCQGVVEHGKRLRRDSGFDIVAAGAPGGRYDMYKAKAPGMKVIKMAVEIPDELAQELNEQLTDVLTRFMKGQATVDK